MIGFFIFAVVESVTFIFSSPVPVTGRRQCIVYAIYLLDSVVNVKKEGNELQTKNQEDSSND